MRSKPNTAKRHPMHNRHRQSVSNSASRDHSAVATAANFVFDSLEGRQLLAAHIVGSSVTYSTIQSAVDAAAAGATVTVDAGTYAEQVFVTKALTIKGAKAGVDARTRSTTGESILTGATANGAQTGSFMITADNVTIDGFTVQGETNKSTTRGAGIVIYAGVSGTHIYDNIIQNNVAGLFLANSSATNAAIIQKNLFQNNNNAGANGGRGIYTDGDITGGKLTNVTIDNNSFINNRGGSGTTGLEAAVAFEVGTAGLQSNFTITNNSFSGNGKAVLFFHTTGVLIQGNSVTTSKDWYSGALRFEGDNHNVTISYNNIFANTGPGVAVDSNGAVGDNSGFVVTHNNIYGNGTTSGGKLGVIFNQSVYVGAFDATNNYWGAASGPSGDGPGTGDSVYGNASKATSWSYAKGGIETYSPWATATISITNVPAPTAPTGLTATPVSSSQIQLAWQVTSTAATAQIIQRSSDGVNFVTVVTTTGSATSYTDTGLASGVTYSYRVLATNTTGTSAPSNVASAKTQPYQAPTAPTGLKVTGVTSSSVSLSWTAPSYTVGLKNYVVYRNGVAVGSPTGTTFTDTGLTANTSYTYTVATADTAGATSSPSASTTGKTTAVPTWSQVALAYNRIGLATDGTKFTGGFDNAGYAMSLTLLGATRAWNGSTFKFGTSGTNNVVSAAGQTIALAQLNGSTLSFIAAAANGNQPNQSFIVRYSDGTTQTVSVSLSDWATPQSYAGESTVLAMTYRNSSTGTKQTTAVKAYGYSITLNPAKVVTGITLPNNANVEILAMNLLATAPQAPSAPQSVSAAAVSTSQINVNWTTTDSPTSFTLQRSTDGTNFTTVSSTIAGTATGYTDTGLAASTKYYYRLYATNAAGTSPVSAVASATTVASNAVTTQLSSLNWVSATAGYGSVQKNLNASGDPIVIKGVSYASGIGTHADSTIVYNLAGKYTTFQSDIGYDDRTAGKPSDPVYFQVIADGTVIYDSGSMTNTSATRSISLNITGVQTLTLVVKAVTPGNIDYCHVDWANARLLSTPQAPAAPTNVTAAGLTTTSIQVGWTAAAGTVTGYRIERSLNSSTWAAVGTVGAQTLSYTDTGLTTGTKYYYRVIATSTAGDSPASNVYSASPLSATAVTTQLSSLDWTSATAGYGSVQKNLNASGDPISVGGVSYASGIGTHADSTIVYNLAGKYTTFQSVIGYDDRTAGKPSDAVYFQVIADGVVIYDSGSMTNTSDPRTLSLNIAGVQTLTLVVKAVVPGNIDYCHVDWAGAQLIA